MRTRIKKDLIQLLSVLLCMIFIFNIVPLIPSYAETDDGTTIVVSMGDSYSSGEGIPPFYGAREEYGLNGNKNKDDDWLAHRSKGSWPGMLTFKGMPKGKSLKDYRKYPSDIDSNNLNADFNWFFVASSGAETKHISNKQTKKHDKYGKVEKEELDPQINVLSTLGEKVDYVTITIGGNDVGFADIIITAAAGVDGALSGYELSKITGLIHLYDIFCPNYLQSKINNIWETFEKTTRNEIKATYTAISKATNNHAEVIIAGYPTLLNTFGIPIFFSASDAIIINRAVSNFNNELAKMVKELNKPNLHFVPVQEEFNGREAYTLNPYLNGIVLPAQSEDLKISECFSAYSIHPNGKGAEAYAKCVQSMLNTLDKSSPAETTTAAATVAPSANTANQGDEVSKAIAAYRQLVAEKNANREFKSDYNEITHYMSNENSSSNYSAGFALIPLDNNKIPELVIWYDSAHVANAELYTYYNSRVVYLGEYGSFGVFNYAPYKGKIESSSTFQGYTSFVICKLENGTVSEILNGDDDAGAVPEEYSATYHINDSPVSEEYYRQVISENECNKLSLYTPTEFAGYASSIGTEG